MQQHVANHADQLGMRACRSRADHLHTKLVTQCSRFSIQVVKYFHVVRNKSDGTDNHAANTGGVLLAQIVADIGRKPGLRGRPAATLVDPSPVAHAASSRYARAGIFELPHIWRRFSHAHGDAVRGEDKLLGFGMASFARLRWGDLDHRGADAVRHLSLIHISEPTRLLSISYAV